jgi:CheY-like chemotaxis protein
MEQHPILIVDDEKNIRLTLSQALETLNRPVRTAVNGEEALELMEKQGYDLVFLDLKMPGMDGLEVLSRIREAWPNTRVVIITAHGNIDTAVTAMKRGAVDFIQKPFSPAEVRELAVRALAGPPLAVTGGDYTDLIGLARSQIQAGRHDLARSLLPKALAGRPDRPEAYNLMGVLLEIGRHKLDALKFYRAALDIDPTYRPAWNNLDRATEMNPQGGIDLGLADDAPNSSGTKEKS